MIKLEKIEREAQKARDKIAAMQTLLKQIEGQRTEQENLQIIHQIRALKLSRDELYTFLSSGSLPAPMLDDVSNALAGKPETIHSRRGKSQQTNPESAAPDIENGATETESEGMNNEE